ncbi:MAG: ribosomal small subunit methyltransferase [Bacillota bacterium]
MENNSSLWNDKFPTLVKEGLGITLSKEKQELFYRYYKELINTNKELNLTAITEANEVVVKHFYDSLLITKVLNLTKINSLIDIGSGAGFPGIPLKIVYPHLKLLLLEARNKKVVFLKSLIDRLPLEEVQALHGRAEELQHNKEYAASFDLIVARAVARLTKLVAYTAGFLRVNGFFVAYKGPQVSEELLELEEQFGNRLTIKVFKQALPLNAGERRLVRIQQAGKMN